MIGNEERRRDKTGDEEGKEREGKEGRKYERKGKGE